MLQLMTSNHRTKISKVDGEILRVSKVLYYLKEK